MAAVAAAVFFAPRAYAQDQTGVLVYQPAFFVDSRPSTAYDMIKRLPGFNLDTGATARGFAGTAGNVLINGQRPTSKSDSLDNILSRIPAADVDHIEVVRGGAPGVDMQGQTVVANVILKKEDSTRIVSDTEVIIFPNGEVVPNQSFQFTRHTGPQTYEGSISLFGNYDDSVGLGRHDVFDASGTLTHHDGASTHGMGIGGSLKGAATLPLFSGEFKANLLLQDSPFNSRLEYFSPGTRQEFIDKSDDKTVELGLHWKGHVGETELESLVLQRFGRNSSTDSSDDLSTFVHFGSKSTTGESIARATLRYLPFDSLTLEGGGEGAFNFLDGQTSLSVNGIPIALPSANARVEERRGEVFAQGTWKPSDEWLLEAGARFEFSTISETGSTNLTRSFTYPKPRAVVSWSPDKDWQIRLRYERIVGQLDFGNFIATSDLASTGVSSGNANLKPDQRTQYAISIERRFWEKGALIVSLMHERISDVVDLVPVTVLGSTFDAPGNIGNGRNNEIKVELTLPLDKLGISGGRLTSTSIWDLSEVTDPVTGMKRVISGQRPQNVRATFTQDLDSLNSTWGLFWYNAWDEKYFRLELVRHRKVVPPFVGVFWNYKPTPDWSINFELDNITRFIYLDRRFEYTGPRNTSPLGQIEEVMFRSQPHLDLEIRKTF